jgi:hypothetical protein
MSELKLIFPSGEFTHTELAQANGKTNQQVWTAYQKAIKDGIIVSAGERPNPSGKGKPSKIWKVAEGQPVPLAPAVIPTPAIQAVPRVKREVKPVKVVEATEASIAEVVEKKAAVVKPTVAPEPEPEVAEVVRKPVIRTLASQVIETELLCPFCKTKLHSIQTEGGVKIWCPVNDLKICSCSENPYGVSNNVKNAYEILIEKFYKHRPEGKA